MRFNCIIEGTYYENEWNGKESNLIAVYLLSRLLMTLFCGKENAGDSDITVGTRQHMRFHEPCQIYLTNLLKQTWKKILIQKQLKQTNETCCCIRCCSCCYRKRREHICSIALKKHQHNNLISSAL